MKLTTILLSMLLLTGCVSSAVNEQSYKALETVAQWKTAGLVNSEELQAIKDRLIQGAPASHIGSLEAELRRISDLKTKGAINDDDTSELRGKAIIKYLGAGTL